MEKKNESCRLCGDNPGSIDVFDLDKFHDGKTPADLIEYYLRIPIDVRDEHSTAVCDSCYRQIVHFDKFAIRCGEIQTRLGNLSHMKIEYEDETRCSIKRESQISPNLLKSENLDHRWTDDEDNVVPLSQIAGNSTKPKMRHNERSKIKKDERNPSMTKDENDCEEDGDNSNRDKTKEFSIRDINTIFSFVCHLCSESFLSWGILKTHCLKKHNAKSKVKCICDKYLYSRRSIGVHFAKHDSSMNRVKCDTCGKSFTSERTLEIHSYKHLSREKYPYPCDQCPKRYLSSLALKVHKKRHCSNEERYIYPCHICGVKFITKGNVKTHIHAVHEKSRPFVCDICGHAFNTKGTLQDHYSTHSDEKLFSCSICSKKFKFKQSLRRHINNHKDTKVKCPQCPVILSNPRSLKLHMFVHDDKLRYTCKICNKGFKGSKALKTHMNLHMGQRPYSCPWCPRTFVDNSNCRIHKKRKHPIELAEYEALHGINNGFQKQNNAETNHNVNYMEIDANSTNTNQSK